MSLFLPSGGKSTLTLMARLEMYMLKMIIGTGQLSGTNQEDKFCGLPVIIFLS